MRHPGIQKGSKPLLALDNPFPMELPENLFGEKWAFVQLPISGTGTAAFTFYDNNRQILHLCTQPKLFYKTFISMLHFKLHKKFLLLLYISSHQI